MKKTILMVSMLGVLFSQISRADEDVLLAQNNQTPNERIGPQVQIPENPMPESKDGPLANQGQWLVDHGITPHLTFTQFYFANPGVGVETDQSESVSIFTVGASLDLEKMIGLSGGTIHYEHLFAPWIHNLNYGMQASSTIVGTLGPYIPKTSHLTLFTYEQKLLDDKLTLEAGKVMQATILHYRCVIRQPYVSVPLYKISWGLIRRLMRTGVHVWLTI